MNPLYLAAGVVALYFITKNKGTAGTGSDAASMRSALLSWSNGGGDSPENKTYLAGVWSRMTAQEIADTYNYVFNYLMAGIWPPPGSALYNSVQAISNKYNIFS